MPNYLKSKQLQSKPKSHKTCTKCDVRRLIKFFEKPTHHICMDCKRKAKYVKRQSSPGKLRQIKDKEWALKIKERDGFKCLYCGKTEYLNSHHIYSRSNYAVRWDMGNGITLCSGHHTMSSKFSAHKTPLEFVDFLKELWGEDWLDRLREKANSVKGTT